MTFPTEYNGGYSYPIQKTPGKWLVIGASVNPDGSLFALDIHLDADDPTFTFVEPGPNIPKKIASAYNTPFRRSVRLKMRRSDHWQGPMWKAHHAAKGWLEKRNLIEAHNNEL